MTDYEHTLTVAIKAISELIEDNRKLRATIEDMQKSEHCADSHQSKPLYGISLVDLTDEIKSAYHEYVGANISTSNAYKIAQHLSDCGYKFIISDGGDL